MLVATTRTKSTFPDKARWDPEGRTLSLHERELLNGPKSAVSFLSTVEVEDQITGRKITYSSSDSERSCKVCSSYVQVTTAHKRNPTFGRIKLLFNHSFNSNIYTWSVVEQFPPSKESQSSLWFVNNIVSATLVVNLSDLSHPLVIARDDNVIWFLN